MERAIRFNDEMVRAILDGRKTQTRRIITSARNGVIYGKAKTRQPDLDLTNRFDRNMAKSRCPYGQIGDLLWVRETWSMDYGALTEDQATDWHIQYRADLGASPVQDPTCNDRCAYLYDNQIGEWRPSIHMPRWATRIKLWVTDVRVERVRDITRGDCMAEGCPFPNMERGDSPIEWFSNLWDSINAKRGYSFDSNPWVWVIVFEVVR